MINSHLRAKQKLENITPFNIKQLIYPLDILDERKGIGQYILFNVSEMKGSRYSKKNRFIENSEVISNPYGDTPVISSSKTSLRGKFNNASKHLQESIVLYMPDTITSEHGINYENTDFGFVGRGVATAAGNREVASIAKSAVGEIASTAAGAVQNLTGANIKDLKNMYSGTISNNMMEVMFKGVNNRNPQFQFRFTPKSEQETLVIKEIIRRFKFYAHPYLKDGQINFFTNPFIVDIVYMMKGEANTWLHRHSTCVIQNIRVNYSGAGEYSVLENDAPTATVLDLSFSELEILTAENFEDEDNSF